MFHAGELTDRQTHRQKDRYDDTNSRCRNFANAPKKCRKQLFSKMNERLVVVVIVLVATEVKSESKFLSAYVKIFFYASCFSPLKHNLKFLIT